MARSTRREFLADSLLATTLLSGAACVSRGPRHSERWLQLQDPAVPIRIAVLGVRGRGRAHVKAFKDSPDTEVVALCDPDEGVIGPAMAAVPGARYVRDLREVLDAPDIDAVSIATPNHWHSLATLWALEAGKHVYVEKPISWSLAEGEAVVAAARRTGLVVQHGTQARSSVATREALAWLRSGALGEVRLARGLCYKKRDSIGKVDGPQPLPATLDHDLWTGPARKVELRRRQLHYDWHWDFETGNGDIGNQGVHQLDIARWGLGLAGLPQRAVGCGGRFGYEDDGNTPNSQLALLDFGEKKILFEVRGLPTSGYRGTHVGVVFHGEGGYLVSSSYTRLSAYDLAGREMRVFEGDGNHFQDFLDAIRAGDPARVQAPPLEGHHSAALGHLANLSYRLGAEKTLLETVDIAGVPVWEEAFGRVRRHLAENGVAARTNYLAGPVLTLDPATGRFVGEHAQAAGALRSRVCRAPYTSAELPS